MKAKPQWKVLKDKKGNVIGLRRINYKVRYKESKNADKRKQDAG
jgi:hypothetical protein